ncbi:Cd(II)/Pb(II)-responsive transcriptional regulator [Aquabacterium sp.]|uniref:Cd(II)/Pb(II)-responsive transcriptional regulator n=1 Tax=Aquabacterium sp. TaxID=1872578 RepID=UPI0010F823DB|nr:Cd(II)/Pb(II)-responsive transcriptional regulator [Aquabacterium sp.]
MKIGDLSAQSGTPVETIRFYEREGLLPKPSRTISNYRIYEGPHVERLAFIRHCRSLDMALDEIRALLALQAAPNESCEAVNNVLDEHIEHVAQRIRELTALKKQLVALRGQCAQAKDVAHCGILSGLGQGETLEQQTARQHVSASHGKRR